MFEGEGEGVENLLLHYLRWKVSVLAHFNATEAGRVVLDTLIKRVEPRWHSFTQNKNQVNYQVQTNYVLDKSYETIKINIL